MVTYLWADLEDALKDIGDTWGCHARFGLSESMYAQQLIEAEHPDGDDEQVMLHSVTP